LPNPSLQPIAARWAAPAELFVRPPACAVARTEPRLKVACSTACGGRTSDLNRSRYTGQLSRGSVMLENNKEELMRWIPILLLMFVFISCTGGWFRGQYIYLG